MESINKNLNIAGINKEKEEAEGQINIVTTTSGDVTLKDLVQGENVRIDAAGNIYQNSAEKTIEAAMI